MNRLLLLTGTCGSSKSTIAQMLADAHGWKRFVVVDATVHEADRGSIEEYASLFASAGIRWQLRVLHPRLHVAVRRAATREGWTAGAAGVEALRRKFSGRLFGPRAFIDTTVDSPAETVEKVLASLGTPLPTGRRGVGVVDGTPPTTQGDA